MRVGEFEWDGEKARANLKKHGVSFEEAMTIFLDERRATRRERNTYEEELDAIAELTPLSAALRDVLSPMLVVRKDERLGDVPTVLRVLRGS